MVAAVPVVIEFFTTLHPVYNGVSIYDVCAKEVGVGKKDDVAWEVESI